MWLIVNKCNKNTCGSLKYDIPRSEKASCDGLLGTSLKIECIFLINFDQLACENKC